MASEDDIDDWASNEFGAAQLGDARLTQRLVALARQLSQSPHCSFPQSLNGPDLKAAYRFFDNPQADTDGVLCPHIDQTLGRMQQVPVVLAAQDTTEFNLAHLPATEGLGYCTGSSMRGFMMHSLLAVTPEGLPLGVLGMKTWVRPPEEYGKKRLRKTMLNEFYRIVFRKKIYDSIATLQADLDAWLDQYNNEREHQGRWCYGKTPMRTFLDSLELAKEKLIPH
ncbi:transposase DNA-binding-containing protein [Burkholderia ubonensis]|uniref:IS4/Tn5 family transposase DNA-binding protein n=1 Tax=Burkholderia ubonensis TaxID=101571 RepID=UPI0009B2ED33